MRGLNEREDISHDAVIERLIVRMSTLKFGKLLTGVDNLSILDVSCMPDALSGVYRGDVMQVGEDVQPALEVINQC